MKLNFKEEIWLENLILRVSSIFYSDPIVKLVLVGKLINYLKYGSIVYLDLNTKFTGYLKQGIIDIKDRSKLKLLLPKGDEFDDAISLIVSSYLSDIKMVIIDELSTFYHIQKGSFSELNRKLGLILTLLKMEGKRRDFFLILLSSYKYGQKGERKISGGRILIRLSDGIFDALRKDNEGIVYVRKHEKKDMEGKEFKFKILD